MCIHMLSILLSSFKYFGTFWTLVWIIVDAHVGLQRGNPKLEHYVALSICKRSKKVNFMI